MRQTESIHICDEWLCGSADMSEAKLPFLQIKPYLFSFYSGWSPQPQRTMLYLRKAQPTNHLLLRHNEKGITTLQRPVKTKILICTRQERIYGLWVILPSAQNSSYFESTWNRLFRRRAREYSWLKQTSSSHIIRGTCLIYYN